MAITPEQITDASVNHVDETKYGAVGNVTKCNMYVQDAVEE